MPSLQMKMKSTMGCLREKNGLHVCQKSIKISKNSSSNFRNFQQKTQLETCISNKQDADSFCSEATVQELRSDETNCCELLEEETIQDHTEANCSSTIETIFSPNTDSNDNDSEATASSNTGNEKDLEVASSSEDKDSEYQICNISDFFISDMTVTTESTSLPDYQCNEESTIFFDDDYMILPFLEDSCNTDSTIASQQSGLYLAIQQLKSHNQETELNHNYIEWDPSELLNPQMFVRNLPELSELDKKTVTLALDLDETLVHSSLEHCEDADFTFSVYFDFKEHTVYVKKRPYLKEFLERVSEMFQVVIFTASQSIYAKQLLDILDPSGKIISKRAYRDSCIFTNGIYTKDLTVLGVDLSKVVIVDNCPQVFQLQVNNGIPIKSWFSDPSDCALITLLPFLETLANAEDVRPIIAKRFGNKE